MKGSTYVADAVTQQFDHSLGNYNRSSFHDPIAMKEAQRNASSSSSSKQKLRMCVLRAKANLEEDSS